MQVQVEYFKKFEENATASIPPLLAVVAFDGPSKKAANILIFNDSSAIVMTEYWWMNDQRVHISTIVTVKNLETSESETL
jgi:hypothetical protein